MRGERGTYLLIIMDRDVTILIENEVDGIDVCRDRNGF
jgi:hypothetical protein